MTGSDKDISCRVTKSALPKLLAARTAAVETSAASNVRTINTALVQFQTRFGIWPTDLPSLGGTTCATTAPTLTAGCFLSNDMATKATVPGVGQYVFTYVPDATGSYTLNADPIAGTAAKRHFFSSSDLAIHYDDVNAATVTDPTIGN